MSKEVTTISNKPYNSNYSQGDCPICCNKGLIIPCKICNKVACKDCIRRYILDNEKEIPACMYCSSVFTRATLVDMLGITFVKDGFTKHQEKVRINKQKTLLPTFQPIAERQIQCEQIEREIRELNNTIYRKREELFRLNNLNNKKKEEKKYIRPCSVSDCNGFLNTSWKCGICSIVTCKDCFEPIINEEHVCEAGAKETATLLKKDTKHCPKCGTGIYKIEGCDQMYCTNCSTAFSWRTGEIETGRIHNPHYYQHLRNMTPNGEIRREPGDIPDIPCCAGRVNDSFIRRSTYIYQSITKLLNVISYNTSSFNTRTTTHQSIGLSDKIKSYIRENNDKLVNIKTIVYDKFTGLIRYYYHVDSIIININRKIQDNTNFIQMMSVNYIRKKITKEEFENNIKSSQKKMEIHNERLLLITTLCDILNDIIVNIFNENITTIYHITGNGEANLNTYKSDDSKTYEESILNYIETLCDQLLPLKEVYQKKMVEIKTIIDYCNNEDSNIKRVYGTKSNLDIKLRRSDTFLENI